MKEISETIENEFEVIQESDKAYKVTAQAIKSKQVISVSFWLPKSQVSVNDLNENKTLVSPTAWMMMKAFAGLEYYFGRLDYLEDNFDKSFNPLSS